MQKRRAKIGVAGYNISASWILFMSNGSHFITPPSPAPRHGNGIRIRRRRADLIKALSVFYVSNQTRPQYTAALVGSSVESESIRSNW
ncbi:hypothetical protein PGTUg99_027770 [Puccinia graminis f. sp. tritici]|uniref:Uncharacterized protein n=1 Tax=Puccinia graminis f. sp. tritici TaxID=56615 RepID=A0A5B0NLH9_PUCGR|nr:hypothetical protein PGTUg99_027770 [Puccinia graminis f. sp. tritici]